MHSSIYESHIKIEVMILADKNHDGTNEGSPSTSLGCACPPEDQTISYEYMSRFLQASSKIPFRNLSTRRTSGPPSNRLGCFFYLKLIITMFLSNMTIPLHLLSLPSSPLSSPDRPVFSLWLAYNSTSWTPCALPDQDVLLCNILFTHAHSLFDNSDEFNWSLFADVLGGEVGHQFFF